MEQVPVEKDEDAAHPVPSAWRPTIERIVHEFVERNYRLTGGPAEVRTPTERDAERFEANVRDYGDELVELPAATWSSSQAQWMGRHWDVIVDLYMQEAGRSDLVLFLCVREAAGRYNFEVYSVHVP